MDYSGKIQMRPRRQTITQTTRRKLTKSEKQQEELDKAGLLSELRKKPLAQLLEELKEAEEGNHPILLEFEKKFIKRTKDSVARIDITKARSMKRIQDEYTTRETKIMNSTDQKLQELMMDMEKDLEALEKRTESEYNSLEINKPTTSSVVDVNKKTLRGRGGVLIEPPTYFNATPKTTIISVNSNARFLLRENDIMEDLHLISSSNNTNQKVAKAHRQYEVQLQKMKFSYDGKSYKQGEEVYVENSEYGKIPAKAENITETVVFFKATQSWDIRQIHASHSDLAEGRVKVYKKKNN